MNLLNPSDATALSQYPLETANLWFPDVFRRYKIGREQWHEMS